MGALMMLAGIVGGVVFAFRAQEGMTGKGEARALVAAQADFARLVRESPDHPEAKLSEAEYVQKHMKKGRSGIGNWLLAMLCLFLLAPLGCFVMVAS